MLEAAGEILHGIKALGGPIPALMKASARTR